MRGSQRDSERAPDLGRSRSASFLSKVSKGGAVSAPTSPKATKKKKKGSAAVNEATWDEVLPPTDRPSKAPPEFKPRTSTSVAPPPVRSTSDVRFRDDDSSSEEDVRRVRAATVESPRRRKDKHEKKRLLGESSSLFKRSSPPPAPEPAFTYVGEEGGTRSFVTSPRAERAARTAPTIEHKYTNKIKIFKRVALILLAISLLALAAGTILLLACINLPAFTALTTAIASTVAAQKVLAGVSIGLITGGFFTFVGSMFCFHRLRIHYRNDRRVTAAQAATNRALERRR